MEKKKWKNSFRASLFMLGMIVITHQTLAYEPTIADAKVRAVIEKRKTLIDAVPDEKLKQLFPLPQDKTGLVGECLKLDVDVEKRSCLEGVAQGFFEGDFTEEAETVCGLLQGATRGEYYVKRCLCYSASNFVAIDKCLAKEDAKLKALLKEQEKANLLDRLLAPLTLPFTLKEVDPSKSDILQPIPQPKGGDLNNEVVGEPLPLKEPEALATKRDPEATVVLNSFLKTIEDKKYFEIFTPDSYAFSLLANIKFLEQEKITEGLKDAQAEMVDANTVKLVPSNSQGTNNYLVKLDNEWYLDNLRATLEQKTAVGAPPVLELDEFLKQKDTLMPLVQKSIQICKGLKSNYFEQKKMECPMQLMQWLGGAYQKKPEQAKDLEVILDFAGEVLSAPDFDAQNFVTEKSLQSIPEGMKTVFKQVQHDPVNFLQETLGDFKEIKKKDENTYLFSGRTDIHGYFVRINNHWLLDMERPSNP